MCDGSVSMRELLRIEDVDLTSPSETTIMGKFTGKTYSVTVLRVFLRSLLILISSRFPSRRIRSIFSNSDLPMSNIQSHERSTQNHNRLRSGGIRHIKGFLAASCKVLKM